MLRRFTLIAIALTLPGLAHAQSRRPHAAYGPPSSGVTFSAWLGLGFPTGRFADRASDVSDVVNVSVPLGVGAYFRPNPQFRFGGFLELAPLSVDDNACGPGESCSGTSYRIGLEAQFHASPYNRFDPWFGLGLGYEWTNIRYEYYEPAQDVVYYDTVKFSGLLFPRVSAGLDFNVSPVVTLGPYLTYSAGQYGHVSETGYGSSSISDKAFHGWFELGIRGNFNL